MDPKALSLILAVVHHGLANLSQTTTPASVNRVIETSGIMHDYLTGRKKP